MAGRPLKFQSVELLREKIVEYFEKTPKELWTITGLAIALDTSRETLCNYQEKEEYFDTIKKAKDWVEHSYELDLKTHGRTGTIFALKNFDWKDKNETDLTSKGEQLFIQISKDIADKNGINASTINNSTGLPPVQSSQGG
jgi:hypothetical protein